MTHAPHDLIEEFPSFTGLIRSLKEKDPYFERLADTYHLVNREIRQLETSIDPAANEREERLHKVRLSLKGEIADILAKASR